MDNRRLGSRQVQVYSAAGLSRLLEHFKEREVAFVSADRGENTPLENRELEKDLAHTIRGMGYGFIDVQGYWEDPGTGVQVPEKTFAVINNQSTPDMFIRRMFSLGERYEQYAIMVVRPDDGHAYYYKMKVGLEYPEDKGVFTNLESKIKEWIIDKDSGVVQGRGHTKIGNKVFMFSSYYSRYVMAPSGSMQMADMRSCGRRAFDADPQHAVVFSDFYSDDLYGRGSGRGSGKYVLPDSVMEFINRDLGQDASHDDT
jgi:hypothetical protein